jgi:hypothetical protein
MYIDNYIDNDTKLVFALSFLLRLRNVNNLI